jgi:LytS/YehU family sensor histidine kinase
MGALLFLLAVAAHYAILAVEATAEVAQREVEARLLAQQAELKALKAQVDPHFLFNSLHSISALTATDPRRAREMCVLLSDFLRASLGLADKQSIRLEEELMMTRHYLAIEQVRFGPRLNLELNIEDEALPCLVPPLLLQPLVENAVTHGLANLTESGYVRVEARRNGSRLKVAVENTFDPEAPSARRNGLGVANVRKRLALRHGELASLSVSSDRDRYRVLLEMPAEEASS